MNDMRKLMETAAKLDEGIFDRAPKAKGTFPEEKRNKATNYSELAKQWNIEITCGRAHWGVAWVDPASGEEGYEERGVNQIVSLDQLVDFAVEEGKYKRSAND